MEIDWEFATNPIAAAFWRLVNWHDRTIVYLLHKRRMIERPAHISRGIVLTRRQIWSTFTLNPRTLRARRERFKEYE